MASYTFKKTPNHIPASRPLNVSSNPSTNIPEALRDKLGDMTAFFDPAYEASFAHLIMTLLPIPDFLLTFGSKGDLSKTRNLRTFYMARLQTMDVFCSLKDTVFMTFYTMLTMTLHTIFAMSVDTKRAWTRYTTGTLLPYVVIDLGNDNECDTLFELQKHLESGTGMKRLYVSALNANKVGDAIITSGITRGVYITRHFYKNLLNRGSLAIAQFPVYTNLLSPKNFTGGILNTKVLSAFPAPAVHDVRVLMTLIRTTTASSSVISYLSPKDLFVPITYLITTSTMRIMTTTFWKNKTVGPPSREEILNIVHQGLTTILAGVTPEGIRDQILKAEKLTMTESTTIPLLTTFVSKVKNLTKNLSISRVLIIIGQKAVGKTTFMASLPDTVRVVDSDDFSSTLSEPLETAICAILAICNSLHLATPTAQTLLGQLMRGDAITLRVAGNDHLTMGTIMDSVHRAYASNPDINQEIAQRESNLIYNIARAIITSDYTLDQSYLDFVRQLKTELRPIVMNVHTDSEAVAIRAVLRRGTVVSVNSSIVPTMEMLSTRPRAFLPFQMAISALYAHDIVCDSYSFDSLAYAISLAW